MKPSVGIGRRGQRTGALMDFASDRDLRRAILLLRLLAQGEADIRARRTTSHAQVLQVLHRRLAARRREGDCRQGRLTRTGRSGPRRTGRRPVGSAFCRSAAALPKRYRKCCMPR